MQLRACTGRHKHPVRHTVSSIVNLGAASLPCAATAAHGPGAPKAMPVRNRQPKEITRV